jgi:hypothetical protein
MPFLELFNPGIDLLAAEFLDHFLQQTLVFA